MQKPLSFIALTTLCVLISACSNFSFPGVYRVDVQQGNIIEQDQVQKLAVGMTRAQVQFVMGSPLVTDTFHPERWDYFYSFRDGEGNLEQEHLKLTFAGDILQNMDRKKYEPRKLESF
jgi:outer membrane protein assembly factor BamE